MSAMTPMSARMSSRARAWRRSSPAAAIDPSKRSEVFEDLFRGAFDGDARRFLDIQDLHHAILDKSGVSLRARAEADAAAVEIHADLFGELGVAVRQEQNLALAARLLLPGGEHEGIVHGDASHGVDAVPLELGGSLDEAREVFQVAGRGEGSRHREHD